MFSLRLQGGIPLSEQLEARIAELIIGGEMAENEKLPAVREDVYKRQAYNQSRNCRRSKHRQDRERLGKTHLNYAVCKPQQADNCLLYTSISATALTLTLQKNATNLRYMY